MKRLYDIMKKLKSEHNLDIKFIIGMDENGFFISDIPNALLKDTKRLAFGFGHIELSGHESESEIEVKIKAVLKALDHDLEHQMSDSEHTNIYKSTIGSIDNSFDTMMINQFGTCPIIKSDHDGITVDNKSGKITNRHVKQ